MEFYTVEHWEKNWEELIERVENGEHIGIENENGNRAVMLPADDELIRLYTEHERRFLMQGTIAYWLMPTAYNGVNWVQFPVVLLLL